MGNGYFDPIFSWSYLDRACLEFSPGGIFERQVFLVAIDGELDTCRFLHCAHAQCHLAVRSSETIKVVSSPLAGAQADSKATVSAVRACIGFDRHRFGFSIIFRTLGARI